MITRRNGVSKTAVNVTRNAQSEYLPAKARLGRRGAKLLTIGVKLVNFSVRSVSGRSKNSMARRGRVNCSIAKKIIPGPFGLPRTTIVLGYERI
jgi:hypothetical protein